MKKMIGKVLAILMVAIFAMSGVSVTFAEEGEVDPNYVPPEVITVGDYGYYVNDDGTATIADYTGDEEVIVVPAEIDGLMVTEIGHEAFDYQKMKSLTIPEGIVRIGMRAFEYCDITEELSMPEGIEIGMEAFAYAELPSLVTIPAGATVEQQAFDECKTIDTVFIGKDAVIESRAFGYDDLLNLVVFYGGNVVEKNAFEYDRALTRVICCGEVEMDEDAFAYCGEIEFSEAEESEFEAMREELLALQAAFDKPDVVAEPDGAEMTEEDMMALLQQLATILKSEMEKMEGSEDAPVVAEPDVSEPDVNAQSGDDKPDDAGKADADDAVKTDADGAVKADAEGLPLVEALNDEELTAWFEATEKKLPEELIYTADRWHIISDPANIRLIIDALKTVKIGGTTDEVVGAADRQVFDFEDEEGVTMSIMFNMNILRWKNEKYEVVDWGDLAELDLLGMAEE